MLVWETEDEVEDGMNLAFGTHSPGNKYPLYMATIARLQLVKKSTLGIDHKTGKRWIYRLVEDLVRHHVLLMALDIQLRLIRKEPMEEQWILAKYFLIHRDGVAFARHIRN